MGLYVNTNIASINAQRNLLTSNTKLAKSFQRLSSGLRVNTAADDAAGLAISERFNSQIRGLTQSVRNANDAVSLVQVAEGALQESTNILQRIRELSVQAASDVNTESDRRALQDEVDQLVDELQRIGDTTTFNQQNLLDGSFTDKFFHIGMNFRETLRVRVRDARSERIGRWAVSTGTEVTANPIAAGGLLINGVTVRATQPSDDQLSTAQNDASAIAKAAAINDSTEYHGVNAIVNPTVREGDTDIGGGVLDQTDFVTINGRVITGITVQADDADEALVQAINAEFEFTGVIATRDDNNQLQLTAADGRNIEISASTAAAAARVGFPAGVDAAPDITQGTVTLESEEQYILGGGDEVELGFVADALVGVSNVQSVETIDITSRDGANLAILIADRAIAQVASDRSELGAVQNRMTSTISNLTAIIENATAARSRILDADFAAESATLAKNQIMTQAATTILAQANQVPQQALSLLQ